MISCIGKTPLPSISKAFGQQFRPRWAPIISSSLTSPIIRINKSRHISCTTLYTQIPDDAELAASKYQIYFINDNSARKSSRITEDIPSFFLILFRNGIFRAIFQCNQLFSFTKNACQNVNYLVIFKTVSVPRKVGSKSQIIKVVQSKERKVLKRQKSFAIYSFIYNAQGLASLYIPCQ